MFIGGEDCTAVSPAKRPTTTVFQDYALFPHMSVGGNVGFGLRMQGVDAATRAARAREALALVGLAAAFDKKPHQLSGGQRQRVALARALVVEPAVLLLDEPLGALDLKLRRQMQDELKAIQKRVGTAFIHVTHDQEEAMALADHCVVMNDGRIEDEGPPERVYARPATRFSAHLHGRKHTDIGNGNRNNERANHRGDADRLALPAGYIAGRHSRRPGHPPGTSCPRRSGRHCRAGHGQGKRRCLPGQLQARTGRFHRTSGICNSSPRFPLPQPCSLATFAAVSCDAGDIILLAS